MVACSSTDTHGNTGSASFDVIVRDTTPPMLSVADVTVNATGPDGTVVSFSPAVDDVVDPEPTVHCVPASDSLFPIGTTRVDCTTSDALGNTSAPQAFNVHVKSAPEQIGDLTNKVLGFLGRSALSPVLRARLQSAATALIGRNSALACRLLREFISVVRAVPVSVLPQAKKDELIGDAMRIRAVIGC